MLGNHKKRNPEPPANSGDSDQSLIPRELPPLRTFVVREGAPAYDVQGQPTGRPVTHVVEAHGVAKDENDGALLFIVFFFVDAEKTKLAQATKLIIQPHAYDEIEEINPLFPTITKN